MSYGDNSIIDKNDPQQQKLSQIGSEKYKWYQKKYLPVEKQFIKNVNNMDNPVFHNTATGMAVTTAKQDAGSQTSTLADSMQGQRMGVGAYTPSSTTQSNAATLTSNNVTGRKVKAEEGVINVGQGNSSNAIQGMGSLAQQSLDGRVTNAKNSFNNSQANNEVIGMPLGAAARTGLKSFGGK